MEYTVKEVQSLIASNKKSIKHWEEFDLSQLKAF